METDLATHEQTVLGVTEEPLEPGAAPPAVVAVVVTRNPGPWLGETLSALAASDYPQLAVFVVDAGSDDDPTPGVAEILPTAFVKRVGAPVGFAAAANEALGAVQGATFLLFCHDDAVVDPSAVRLLVEQAYRSNAAVVGPKVVDASDPEVLLEVGLSIDRFGATYTGLEPRELDQAQHDSARRLLRVEHRRAGPGRPVRRARGLRPRGVPRQRGPRPLLAGPAPGRGSWSPPTPGSGTTGRATRSRSRSGRPRSWCGATGSAPC